MDLVLVSLPSKGKSKELPVPPDNLDVKIGILQVDSDEPVPSLNLRHDRLQRQHLELPFVKGEVQATQVQNGSQAAVPFRYEEVAAEKKTFLMSDRGTSSIAPFSRREESSCCSTEAFEALFTTVSWTEGGISPKRKCEAGPNCAENPKRYPW